MDIDLHRYSGTEINYLSFKLVCIFHYQLQLKALEQDIKKAIQKNLDEKFWFLLPYNSKNGSKDAPYFLGDDH
jgi:outer membrane protein assembly factor BamD (BamD/ComL family)